MALEIREGVPLSSFSTLGIGGPARYYARVETEDGVRAGVAWAAERDVPLLVLGGGSNLVIADAGHPGLVLHVAPRGVDVRPADGRVEVTGEAGEPWDDLVGLAVSRGWAGLECLSGIPGLVGATPMQNVGAYGQEVRETITRVEALDRRSGAHVVFSNAECGFAYRHSRFKGDDRDRYVILRVTFALTPGGEPAVRYPELSRHLEEAGTPRASVADVREAVLALRRRKSMVLDAADPNARSVGSFFMNPIVSEGTFASLEDRMRRAAVLAEGEHPPHFPADPGRVKLSAAWLIEHAGLARGHGRGNVGLSSRHTLAIVNRGGASAAEVVAFAREIRETVEGRFGIRLEPEPVFVHLSLDDPD